MSDGHPNLRSVLPLTYVQVLLLLLLNFNIAKFGDIGTWVSCKCDESVKVSVCLELISTSLQLSQIVYFIGHRSCTPIDHAH